MTSVTEYALEIRNFNRFYTNFIGLVNQTILESPYSLAEVRVLLEIRTAEQCTASDLTRLLQIDPGYLSRILRRFKREQLIIAHKCSADGRSQLIRLTDGGRQTIDRLQSAATEQVARILGKLQPYDQQKLVGHMQAIRSTLSAQEQKEVIIRPRRAGDAGYIAHMHGVLYEKEYGLDKVFEQYVLAGIVKFLETAPTGEIWVAEYDGQIIGSIAMVGIDGQTAQLRWFLIDPAFRGMGLGRRLIEHALDYCRQNGFTNLFLWTFVGLDAACHLYHSFGFRPTEQVENNTWKNSLIEQRWDAVLSK